MKRSSDPLTAATTAILNPILTSLGFQKLGTRSFVRVNEGVLQYIELQLSAGGSKDFAVNYAAITLFAPRDYMVLEPGGRLPRIDGHCDGWWSAKTHELANDSMRDVVERFNSHCLSWFERTKTTRGLLEVLIEKHGALPRPHAHLLFDSACCQTRVREVKSAEATLQHAASVYHQWHQEMPARTWCLDCIIRCDLLLTAIREIRHESLLAEWFTHSVRTLKLGKILGA